jgi:hypothetical protein
MRQILGAAAFVAIAFTAAPAAAQDYPYCLQGQQWGYPGNCEFTSNPQCDATASGTDSYCGLNPRFAYGQPQLSTSSVKARFIGRPHRNGFAGRGMARGAAAEAFKRRAALRRPAPT